jgi:4'-phosphopantetheinyl transferase
VTAGSPRLVVTVYRADASGVPPGPEVEILDPGELARAASYRNPADTRGFVVAHVTVRRVLACLTGMDPAALRFARDPCPLCGEPHGRPIVVGVPALHFSLSHAGSQVVVAVADRPVGVDVEETVTEPVVAELSALFHPQEQVELSNLTGLARESAFTRLWTRKEAYLKGLGTGLGRNLNLDYVGTRSLASSPAAWEIRELPVPDGYAAAAAVAVPEGEPVTILDAQIRMPNGSGETRTGP